MRRIVIITILLSIEACTNKCNLNYSFDLYYIITGSNEKYYYYFSDCSSNNWDTNLILKYIKNDSNLYKYPAITKYVAFFNSKGLFVSRNESDIDDAAIEEYLIVRYIYQNGSWRVKDIGTLSE